MTLSNMQIFEQYAYGSATETIQQQTELFNAASGGTITLVTSGNEGDFSTETFWQNIPNLMRRRDAYGTGVVAPVALSQAAETGVKIAGGSAPIEYTIAQFSWIQKSPEEAGVVIGEQIGKGMMVDYINSAIRAGSAAMANNAGVLTDVTGAVASRSAHVSAAGKFGDAMGDIAAWVMHSKSMTDIYQENLANANRLFEIGNIRMMEDGFGRVYLMTDSPDLVDGTTYRSLGLTTGAISIEENGDLYTTVQEIAGGENIRRISQTEYTFNAKVKGYSWDKANGGASPTDAAIGTGTNWDKSVLDDKNTAGVLLLSD